MAEPGRRCRVLTRKKLRRAACLVPPTSNTNPAPASTAEIVSDPQTNGRSDRHTKNARSFNNNAPPPPRRDLLPPLTCFPPQFASRGPLGPATRRRRARRVTGAPPPPAKATARHPWSRAPSCTPGPPPSLPAPACASLSHSRARGQSPSPPPPSPRRSSPRSSRREAPSSRGTMRFWGMGS